MATPGTAVGRSARPGPSYVAEHREASARAMERDARRGRGPRTTRQLTLSALFQWPDVTAVGLVLFGIESLHVSAGTGLGLFLTTKVRLGVVLLTLGAMLAWHRAFRAAGLYDEAVLRYRGHEAARILASCALLAGLTTALGGGVPSFAQHHGRVWFGLLLFGGTATAILLLRTALRWWVERVVPIERHVIIVGTGPRAVRHVHTLEADHRHRYTVVAWVDRRTVRRQGDEELGPLTVEPLAQLGALLGEVAVDEVHIALPLKSCYDDFQYVISLCEHSGVRVVYGADHFEHVAPALTLRETPTGSQHVATRVVARSGQLPLKRCSDVAAATVGLLALAPVFLAIALAIRLETPGPVLFRQKRLGVGRRPFDLFKFRSMRVDAEQMLRRDPQLYEEYVRNGFKLPEGRDPRVTRVGRVLRKTSLDELPQLWNVLRGDMSVVGPRPIVPAEAANYGARTPLLLHLKPGLTGAWVVGGRSRINYPERADLELQYVADWSLAKDMLICLRSIPAILLSRGAH